MPMLALTLVGQGIVSMMLTLNPILVQKGNWCVTTYNGDSSIRSTFQMISILCLILLVRNSLEKF